jgi:hypothetical protein
VVPVLKGLRCIKLGLIIQKLDPIFGSKDFPNPKEIIFKNWPVLFSGG